MITSRTSVFGAEKITLSSIQPIAGTATYCRTITFKSAHGALLEMVVFSNFPETLEIQLQD